MPLRGLWPWLGNARIAPALREVQDSLLESQETRRAIFGIRKTIMKQALQARVKPCATDNGACQVLCLYSAFSPSFVTFRTTSNHSRSDQPPSPFFPFTFQRGETHAIWPQSVSPSSNDTNHSSNLSRHRTSGVRTSTRCLPRCRPVNGEVSNLRSLREDRFPAREKTACGGTHSALAKNSLIKFSRSATNALVMLLGVPPSISPASLGGGHFFCGEKP